MDSSWYMLSSVWGVGGWVVLLLLIFTYQLEFITDRHVLENDEAAPVCKYIFITITESCQTFFQKVAFWAQKSRFTFEKKKFRLLGTKISTKMSSQRQDTQLNRLIRTRSFHFPDKLPLPCIYLPWSLTRLVV